MGKLGFLRKVQSHAICRSEIQAMVIFTFLIYLRVLENARINIHVIAKKIMQVWRTSQFTGLARACASGGPEHTQ